MTTGAKEVLAVLKDIGHGIKVDKNLGHKMGPCHVDVLLSNGWLLRIFDECCNDFDYLEAIYLPDGTWFKYPKGDAPAEWHDVWEWSPDWDPEAQQYTGTEQRTALGLS